jgi:hypothetical protein
MTPSKLRRICILIKFAMKNIFTYMLFSVFSVTFVFANNVYNSINLSDSEKIEAITNFLVNEKLNISKPVIEKKPEKPYVKSSPNLIKKRFETTIEFNKRLQQAKDKREIYLSNIENDYAEKVLLYNKKVSKQMDTCNKKVRLVKSNIKKIKTDAIEIAIGVVYGKPIIKNIDYDADNGIYYGQLTSKKGDFNKRIAIKVPISIAEDFYESTKNPKVSYEYNEEKIFLKEIQVLYKGKNYIAMLTDTDYKSTDMNVKINSRDLNLQETKLLSSTLILDKQDFDIGNINYGKSKVAKLDSKDLEALNKQRLKNLSESTENLSSLLNNSKETKKNPKAYAIVFGVEDYMLESNVNYSQNSAMMFMQYANKLLGVPDDNIWAFVGNKTSSGFIKSQWNDFLSLIEPDATVYFYYSGHGVPGSDGNAYILPSDTNAETATNDKTFMLKNIYSNLSKTKAKKVVAFVDSCFSGKDDKGSLLFDGVAPVLKVKKTTFDKSKMTIFTAGSSKNFSNQYKEKKHRLFSYYLMKGLAKGKTDTQELFTYVKKNVANKSRKLGSSYLQIPELMGKSNGSVK